MSTDLYKKTVEYIKSSSAVLEAAEKQASERETEKRRASARIPGCVDRLVERGLIQDVLREKAAQAFQSHERTLEFLEELAARVNPPAPAALGAAEKSAAARPYDGSAFLGSRLDRNDERESDQILFEKFGIR